MNLRGGLRLRILSLAPLFAATAALAYPPTYGTEFNFVSPKIEQAARWRLPGTLVGKAEHQFAEAMVDQVRRRCPTCQVSTHKGKFGFEEYKVTVPDGSWWFNIAVDPGCVEVQTSPATSNAIRDQIAEMKKYIFDSAKGSGLSFRQARDIENSTAHLNIGARSAFEGDVKGFMRYLVDYQNNPALGAGVFGDDFANAPLLSELKPEQRKAFTALVEDVNAGKVETIDVLARRMNYEVYTWTPTFNKNGLSSGQHYQSFGMKQLIKSEFANHDMPFELRAVRMPTTPEEYQLLTELMDARIDFMKKQEGPIHFVDTTKVEIASYRSTAEIKALEFHLYVSELGLDPKKYESLITPDARKALHGDHLARVLGGEVKLKNESDLAILDYLAKRALTSPASEKAFYGIIEKQSKPADVLATLLDRIYYDAEKGTETAEVILERTKRMITQAAAHGMPVQASGHEYLEGLEKLTRPASLATKCVRWLKNPFGWW